MLNCSNPYILPAHLDATALEAALSALREQDCMLDASQVERIGTLGLQLLHLARARVCAVSDSVREAAELLSITIHD